MGNIVNIFDGAEVSSYHDGYYDSYYEPYRRCDLPAAYDLGKGYNSITSSHDWARRPYDTALRDYTLCTDALREIAVREINSANRALREERDRNAKAYATHKARSKKFFSLYRLLYNY